MQFEDLRLTEPLLRAIRTAGYRTPTPIQVNAIPIALAGRDVLGCAQTGTGKTAAFALPILQRLSDRSQGAKTPSGRVRALVLCPTRELAQQIHDSFRTYGRHTGLRQTVVFGGVKQGPQVKALKAGVDILVATPGRLLDLMGQRLANVSNTEILVLDEADHMLDMGFLPDLRRILKHVPNRRQTLLFSATMPPPIRKLADDVLHNAESITVSKVSSPPPTVKHSVFFVEKPKKQALLRSLLKEESNSRTLVFSRTKHGADKIVRRLGKDGVNAAAIHGNKSQGQRTRALAEFRSGKTPVLIATDIAARGLDIDNITRVVNFDLTAEPETYVHRIGRTGRAGVTGTAVSFCAADEFGLLRAIERLLNEPLERANHPLATGDPAPPTRRVTNSPKLASRQHSRRSQPSRSPNKGMRRGKPSKVSAAS